MFNYILNMNIIIDNLNRLIDSLYLEKPPNYSFKVNSFKKQLILYKILIFKLTQNKSKILKASEKAH